MEEANEQPTCSDLPKPDRKDRRASEGHHQKQGDHYIRSLHCQQHDGFHNLWCQHRLAQTSLHVAKESKLTLFFSSMKRPFSGPLIRSCLSTLDGLKIHSAHIDLSESNHHCEYHLMLKRYCVLRQLDCGYTPSSHLIPTICQLQIMSHSTKKIKTLSRYWSMLLLPRGSIRCSSVEPRTTLL